MQIRIETTDSSVLASAAGRWNKQELNLIRFKIIEVHGMVYFGIKEV